MKIIEFLKLNGKEEYDFSEDWKNGYDDKLLDEYKNMDTFKKYFVFKWQNGELKQQYEKTIEFYEKNRKIIHLMIDPDSKSCLLQGIYKKLWSSDILKYCNDDGKDNIHGDTMNTIQTTLSKFIRLLYADEYYANKNDSRFYNYQGSKLQCTEIFLLTQESFIDDEKKRNILKKFIKYNHTLGNFIPVPFYGKGRFNGPRSNGDTDDFWDLTLFKIREWVKENGAIKKCDIVNNSNNKLNNNKLEELLKYNTDNNTDNKNDNVNSFICWFLSFADGEDENLREIWKNFIRKNFLEDYVNNDYEVIQYNNGLRVSKYTVCDCIKYFEQATERIIKRTNRMINKLNEICHT